MARKTVDPLKAKQKKQKIVATVLGVVFVGLLAFQVPRVMKQLHPAAPVHSSSSSSSSSSTTTTTAGTPSLAAPTLSSGSQTPGAGSGSDPSLASAAAAAVADGQLTSFSRFASKDPFAQQLSDKKSSSSPGASGGDSSTSSGGGTKSSSGGSASAPNPGTAIISVNGTLYTVTVGSKGQPKRYETRTVR